MIKFAIISIVLLGCLIVLYYSRKSRKLPETVPEDTENFPYARGRTLLTPEEQSFFLVLTQALADRYNVFAKVKLTEILKVRSGVSEKRLEAERGKIWDEYVDFVVCDKEDSSILGVVELDETTHQPDGRRRRNATVDHALSSAGIPVVYAPVREDYAIDDIRIEMSRSLFLQWKENNGADAAKEVEKNTRTADRPVAEKSLGLCPDCGSPLKMHQAKKGKFAGKHFLTSSRYPRCKNIRLVKDQSPLTGNV